MATRYRDSDSGTSTSDPRDLGNSPGDDNYWWWDTGKTGSNVNMLGAVIDPNNDFLTEIQLVDNADTTSDPGWNRLSESSTYGTNVDRFTRLTSDTPSSPNEQYHYKSFVRVNVQVTYSDGTSPKTIEMQAMRLGGQNTSYSLHDHWLIRPSDADLAGSAGDLFEGSTTLADIVSMEITSIASTGQNSIQINQFDDHMIFCYTRGTLIRAKRGDIPIEDITVDDEIYAHERGWLPVLWLGRSRREARGNGRAVHLPQGLFGLQRDTVTSLQHCMLIRAGGKEYFVPAKWLADENLMGCRFIDNGDSIEYFHLLLSRHAVIEANGARSESFYPGVRVAGALRDAQGAGLNEILPGLEDCLSDEDVRELYGPRARPVLGDKNILRQIVRQPGTGLTDQPDKPVRCSAA